MRVNVVGRDCRTYGHMWRPYDAKKEGRYFYQELRCSDCQAQRTDKIKSNGETIGRKYKYPGGFAYPKGSAPNRRLLKKMALDEKRARLWAV